MRILHIIGGLNRGGAETWLLHTLRHIDRSKYKLDFLVHTDEACAYDEEVRKLGARIFPCLSPSQPFRYGRNFLRILRENGPYDCVHSHVHYFSGYTLALARLGGVPLRIAHSHISDSGAGGGRRGYKFAMDKLLKLCATAGVGVSAVATQSLFGRAWKSDPRWQTSHLGIDLAPFSCPVDSDQARAELGIPKDAFVVGHVGRFFAQKNHTFLLDIAKQVLRKKPHAIFLLVGEGPLRKAIERKAANLGIRENVKFAGIRNDTVRLMKGVMDVFLFPSLYEGFPLVLMEAQAAGLRCFVASTVSDEANVIPQLITRLSLTDDASTWADHITGAPVVVAGHAPEDVMHDFSIEPAINRLCHIYEQGRCSPAIA